jgi:hypothetical protein
MTSTHQPANPTQKKNQLQLPNEFPLEFISSKFIPFGDGRKKSQTNLFTSISAAAAAPADKDILRGAFFIFNAQTKKDERASVLCCGEKNTHVIRIN